ARGLIDVDWKPLPSVQDPATPAGPARVHDDVADNLAGRVTLRRGDVAAALAAAPRRARLTLHVGRAGGQPVETPRLVAADRDAAPDCVGLGPGAAPGAAVHRRPARPRAAPRARGGARRRRRFWRQAHRLSRGRADPVPGAALWPPRALAGGSAGAHAERDPG